MVQVELGLAIGVTIAVGVLPFLGPAIHHCLLYTFRKYNKKRVNTQGVCSEFTEADIKRIFDQEISWLRTFSKHLTVWTWLWILYYIITAILSTQSDISVIIAGHERITLLFVLNIAGYAELVLFVIFLYIETFFCLEWKYLTNMLHDNTLKTYTDQLREEKPSVTITASAWHLEKVTISNQSGSSNIDVFVTDHTETEDFHFSKWEDVTPDLSKLGLDPSRMTGVKVYMTVLLGDATTKKSLDICRHCG